MSKKKALLYGFGVVVSSEFLRYGATKGYAFVKMQGLPGVRDATIDTNLGSVLTPAGEETCCGKKLYIYLRVEVVSESNVRLTRSKRIGRNLKCATF